MTVDGVTEVVSFDDVSVLLVTTCGEMTVEGSDLKLSQLDTERGCVCVCGRIGGIYYGDDLPKKRRRRMFASE